MGGDFHNNNVPFRCEKVYENGISCCPDSNECPTTMKMRTFLQSQKKKSNWVDKKCRHYILTNMQVKESRLLAFGPNNKLHEYRGPEHSEYMYLPNNEHFFDSVVVSVTLANSQ